MVLASWVAADVRRCWTCSISCSPVDIPAILICFPRVLHKEVWLARGVVSLSVDSHTGVCQCLSAPSARKLWAWGAHHLSNRWEPGSYHAKRDVCLSTQEQFVRVVGDVCDLSRFPRLSIRWLAWESKDGSIKDVDSLDISSVYLHKNGYQLVGSHAQTREESHSTEAALAPRVGHRRQDARPCPRL